MKSSTRTVGLDLYVDSSAVVKLYVRGRESAVAAELLAGAWATSRHTFVEVRRALAQVLDGDEAATA